MVARYIVGDDVARAVVVAGNIVGDAAVTPPVVAVARLDYARTIVETVVGLDYTWTVVKPIVWLNDARAVVKAVVRLNCAGIVEITAARRVARRARRWTARGIPRPGR